MPSYDIMKNQVIAESKYLKLKEEYDNLIKLRELSNGISAKYDQDYDYEEVLPYYKKVSECYCKIEKLELVMRTYKSFAHNLKYLAEKKKGIV